MRSILLERLRYGKGNPAAPPDRRYRKAKAYSAYGCQPSFRYDDRSTWDLWSFLKKRETAFEPDLRDRLFMAYRGLSVALQIHHGSLRQLRPIAEAYILAGADDALIAKRLAVATEAIRWFRLAFFDIEHLRQADPRVIHDLIGITDEQGQSTLDVHRFWKLVGFKGGPAALDQLFHDTLGDKAAFRKEGLAAWLSQQTQSVLSSKQFIAACNLNASDPKHAELLLKLRLQEQRMSRQSGETPLTPIERHIDAMLMEFPWCHGAAAQEAYEGSEIGECDKRAAELRDEELLLLAAGEKVPELEKIKDLQMPLAPEKGPIGKAKKESNK